MFSGRFIGAHMVKTAIFSNWLRQKVTSIVLLIAALWETVT